MRKPKYRRHSTRPVAFVEFQGKRHYLPGVYDSHESWTAYREFLRANCQAAVVRPKSVPVAVLVDLHRLHAETYYPPGQSSEIANFKYAAAYLLRYGELLVTDFGPLKLKEIQRYMATTGKSRNYINACCRRIKQIFKWGASEELVPTSVWQALCSVPGLTAGRTQAKETQPRRPVSWEHVEPVLPYLKRRIRDMVLVMWYTGVRPTALCQAKGEDFDRSQEPWVWTPLSKSRHLGRHPKVFVGPRCQKVLERYMKPKGYLFSPPTARFTSAGAFRAAIRKAIKKANRQRETPIPHWIPYQLRHAKATAVWATHGLEAAQVSLGHAHANVTEIYAQSHLALAARVAMESG